METFLGIKGIFQTVIGIDLPISFRPFCTNVVDPIRSRVTCSQLFIKPLYLR